MSRPSISLIIPAYNESERLPGTLKAVDTYLSGRPGDYEILVADDGSTDGTAQVAASFLPYRGSLRVLASPVNLGKGNAVRRGVLASRGDVVAFTDADLSAPIAELDRLISALDRCEAAIASRVVRGAWVRVPQPLHRRLMGLAFKALVKLLFFPDLEDTQCGLKAFRGEAARRAFALCRVDGFAFDVEVLAVLRRLGCRVCEVPVIWDDSPRSRVRLLRDPGRMLADLLRVRLGLSLGAYGPASPARRAVEG
ncbi:MAG: glycosyltransferase family 2 protein [Acetobacteraceae bacterium]|nr:glycosyltransferase family 2 protein [Acetobacteraceae bacterium]